MDTIDLNKLTLPDRGLALVPDAELTRVLATAVEEDEAILASYMVLPGIDGGGRELLQVRLATEFRLREKAVLRRLVDALRDAPSLSEWVETVG